MATHNDITGDALVSRLANDNYRNNYDRIFGKKKEQPANDAQDESTSVSVSVESVAECSGAAGSVGK